MYQLNSPWKRRGMKSSKLRGQSTVLTNTNYINFLLIMYQWKYKFHTQHNANFSYQKYINTLKSTCIWFCTQPITINFLLDVEKSVNIQLNTKRTLDNNIHNLFLYFFKQKLFYCQWAYLALFFFLLMYGILKFLCCILETKALFTNFTIVSINFWKKEMNNMSHIGRLQHSFKLKVQIILMFY